VELQHYRNQRDYIPVEMDMNAQGIDMEVEEDTVQDMDCSDWAKPIGDDLDCMEVDLYLLQDWESGIHYDILPNGACTPDCHRHILQKHLELDSSNLLLDAIGALVPCSCCFCNHVLQNESVEDNPAHVPVLHYMTASSIQSATSRQNVVLTVQNMENAAANDDSRVQLV